MISGKRILALVPARGGSKGIAGKNLANCAGKPLLSWTLDAAWDSEYIDDIRVSSDSPAILDAAVTHGAVPLERPAELAADDTPMEDVALHALDHLERSYDLLVLLQPTSPLRTTPDIDQSIEMLDRAGANSLTSVHESYALPFVGAEPKRRQEREPTLYMNGAIYIVRVPWFRDHRRFIDAETVPFVIPAERAVDVDYPIDLALASLMIGRR